MKISRLSPNFEVNDIKKTVAFYTEHFEFKLIMAVPETQDGVEQTLDENKEYVYAMMQKDSIEFMFQRSDTFKNDIVFSKDLPIGATVSFYMDIEGIKDFYLTLKKQNLEITEIKTTWYGMQEFYIKDLNGYILGFSEKNE
ncbi:putative glyoxalase superfamily protein PhnB [Flavobacterium sp. HSC-32F16]|uniref:VOC family protein n=1 Tax=Flavobacterium sp. HSC-32F16 TaxID=2910964 RepID=UPI0020A410A3|nr:VOC family protein [Flavobacterium sp. HSC-32F16]MCP2027193.1 putative glyoxalase superfamily protein PhnB [Flavobacterium sp. HSC-32F16]